MNSNELVKFSQGMERKCNVRFVKQGLIDWISRMLYERLIKKYASFLPELTDVLRPMALKNLIILNFEIGCTDVHWRDQIRIMTHECQHSIDIRKYCKTHKKRAANWYRNYFLDETFRSIAEGYSNTAERELDYAIDGIYKNPVCDYGAYLIVTTMAKKAFRRGCEKRRHEVIDLGPGNASQQAAKAAIALVWKYQ